MVRIIKSLKELYDDAPEINENKSKKKTLKQFIDSERGKGTYIKGDSESKGKSESQIEKELESYFNTIPDCAWWNIKESGKLQSIGNGRAIIKESKNRGFADFILCVRGLFIMVEAKAPGRYQSPWQIDQQEKVRKKGLGYYFIATSVNEINYLFSCFGILVKD